MPELTDVDRALLDAWSQTWQYPGRRDSVLLEQTKLTPTQQHQRLNVLIDTEAAMVYAPITCRRLRQVRARRQRSRRTA